ncbi:MAG: hypothetical protein EB084_10730 [Proteobacteria bacterium]|nr:hypothetical protein [Pseudomonadota bacterium]
MEAAESTRIDLQPSARALEVMALIERARDTAVDDADITGELEQLAQRLVALGRGLLEIDLPETAEDIVRIEIETGVEAAEGFLAALETVERARLEGDLTLLDAAQALVEAADARLREAVRLNEENRMRLEAIYIDNSLVM